MRIYLLGGSGFIGRNLQIYLHNQGYEVCTISLRNKNWSESVKDSESILINLVGKAHDHKGQEEDYYYANVELAKEIFYLFHKSSSNLLVHVSSIAALEEFESSEPLIESNRCNPSSWYGKSKYTAEKWLMSQELPPDKKMIILRPPMVHGQGDKGNLGLLFKLISKGIPYPLSSFNNKRSFISVDNFSFFIHRIIVQYKKLDSSIYHVADDENLSTKDIIEIIKQKSGKKVADIALPKFLVKGLAKIGDFLPFPLNSMRLKKMTSDLLVSNDKIKNHLNIRKLPLSAKEGMEKTIKSFVDGML